jgi:hypothetical protein
MDINFFKENFEKLYGILITQDILPQNLKYELIVIENEYDQLIEKSHQLSEEDFEQKDIYGLRCFWVYYQKQLICVKQGRYEPYDRVEYAVHCIYAPSDLMEALSFLFLKSFTVHIRGLLLTQWIEGSLQFEIDQLEAEKYQALSMQKKQGLNEEILRFLNNYPNLYALFSALYSRDLTQFNSPLVLETVEKMGGIFTEKWADFKQSLCLDEQRNPSWLIFYILNEAVLNRYFPETGLVEWKSASYLQQEKNIDEQLAKQKEVLLQCLVKWYVERLEQLALKEPELWQLNQSLFPESVIDQYIESLKSLMQKIRSCC